MIDIHPAWTGEVGRFHLHVGQRSAAGHVLVGASASVGFGDGGLREEDVKVVGQDSLPGTDMYEQNTPSIDKFPHMKCDHDM